MSFSDPVREPLPDPLDEGAHLCSDEPSEHVRFAAYLDELAHVDEAHETELVVTVLGDPDPTMAGSAVLRHLDRRAAELCAEPGFEPWAATMAEAVRGVAFLERRLREWALYRAVVLGQPWSAEELLASSDWLQLRTAESAGPESEATAVLAERARTRRIRHTARINLSGRRRGQYS